jgi:ABC-type uncharacterized transport system permease subunit
MLEAFWFSTVSMATPILLAALGELIVERSDVLNIGIEGAMLSGAFFALAGAFFCHSLMVGLGCGIVAAVAINALLAVMVVNLAVNQVVAGTALDILALGLNGVFYRRLFGVTGRAFTVIPMPRTRWARSPIFRLSALRCLIEMLWFTSPSCWCRSLPGSCSAPATVSNYARRASVPRRPTLWA